MISKKQNIPTKSDAYRFAESVFFDQFTKINFFVEDADQENLYYQILSKLFPNIKLKRIFPLGGKSNVIAHIKVHARSKKNIYIVDKDFDDLLGKVFNYPNLFYLEQYSIENYFLDEKAMVELILDEMPKLNRRQICTRLNFKNMYTQSLQDLKYLFSLFLVVQKRAIPIENCGLKCEKFCSTHRYQVDPAKVICYQTLVISAAVAAGQTLNIRREVAKAYPFNRNRLSLYRRHIAGKFILKLFYHWVKKQFFPNHSMTFESFCYRIAKEARFETLEFLKAAIESRMQTVGIST